jgi:hypothetical protein
MEAIVAIFIAIILLSGQGYGHRHEAERNYSVELDYSAIKSKGSQS